MDTNNGEFPEGKDKYCPRCYFEEEKTILRVECGHQKATTKDTRKVVGGKTVFQEFADFLAQDKGDRGAVYEVAVSESSMVILRRKDIKKEPLTEEIST